MTHNELKFTVELVLEILSYHPNTLFLVNKKLTDAYFRLKYEKMKIEFPRQSKLFTGKNTMFPHATYVIDMEIQLKGNDKYKDFDFTIFKNVKYLHFANDGSAKLLNAIILQFPQITRGYFLYINDVYSLCLVLDQLQNLTYLQINAIEPFMTALNNMPNLKEICVCNEHPFNGSMNPLLHISKLTTSDPRSILILNSLFPNLESLVFQGCGNHSKNELMHLKVIELSCGYKFRIPTSVMRLTLKMENGCIEVPEAHRVFEWVRFELSNQVDSESIASFERCIQYCHHESFPVTISLADNIIFSNKKLKHPRIKNDTHKYECVQDIHIHYKIDHSDINTAIIAKIKWTASNGSGNKATFKEYLEDLLDENENKNESSATHPKVKAVEAEPQMVAQTAYVQAYLRCLYDYISAISKSTNDLDKSYMLIQKKHYAETWETAKTKGQMEVKVPIQVYQQQMIRVVLQFQQKIEGRYLKYLQPQLEKIKEFQQRYQLQLQENQRQQAIMHQQQQQMVMHLQQFPEQQPMRSSGAIQVNLLHTDPLVQHMQMGFGQVHSIQYLKNIDDEKKE